ncbi:type II toxin-antitoxin system RelE/ParE family toxin [Sphingomonas qomolangmaensis]|uniref:Type II toxin-antitoxin system RelE/ParE family toxin n=1 Tax=Sphingomonas qomolangmaensis TaxID=2918765 RepID=A0ABY5L7U8_9SPHN|nr:type II toxin-antitoxin system RelE/ParE family toxin [Sphingomonas qomolangmaensis]UUL81874.1 type II toxin-antitoxin system RelE/ParE family toxin [Sphingomonas qomolangmaensis]
MLDLNWTPEALKDLRAIERWLIANRTPHVAMQALLDIRLRAQSLEEFPHAGRPERDGIRILVVYGSGYLIFYRIIEAGVQILRVRNEREDWQLAT